MYFDTDPEETCTLTVYSAAGKTLVVKLVSGPRNEVDVTSFSGGLYLYRLVSNSGKINSGKFIVE